MNRYTMTDRWTTQDGEWFVTDKPYSIDQSHLERWGHEPIDGRGCATCCFVKLDGGPGAKVLFKTTAGLEIVKEVDQYRWAHNEMFNPGSGYNPANNIGPWTERAQDAPSDIEDDIGLPGGNHVSTFIVMTWQEEDGPTPPDPGPNPPDPTPGPDTIIVMVRVGNDTYAGPLSKQDDGG